MYRVMISIGRIGKKEKDSLELPFPNLPYLIIGPVKLTQSNAILNYLTKYAPELGGITIEERAEIDMLVHLLTEFRNTTTRVAYDKNFEEQLRWYQSDYLPNTLASFAIYLRSREWLISHLTYVDFIFYEILDQNRSMVTGCLDKFPTLSAYCQRFEVLPAVAQYRQSSGFISRPINNKAAAFR